MDARISLLDVSLYEFVSEKENKNTYLSPKAEVGSYARQIGCKHRAGERGRQPKA